VDGNRFPGRHLFFFRSHDTIRAEALDRLTRFPRRARSAGVSRRDERMRSFPYRCFAPIRRDHVPEAGASLPRRCAPLSRDASRRVRQWRPHRRHFVGWCPRLNRQRLDHEGRRFQVVLMAWPRLWVWKRQAIWSLLKSSPSICLSGECACSRGRRHTWPFAVLSPICSASGKARARDHGDAKTGRSMTRLPLMEPFRCARPLDLPSPRNKPKIIIVTRDWLTRSGATSV